jgi:hypothetical protein
MRNIFEFHHVSICLVNETIQMQSIRTTIDDLLLLHTSVGGLSLVRHATLRCGSRVLVRHVRI